MIGQENVTLRMIILTSFSTIEFDSHGDVVNPGTRVHTDEPGSEGRVKTVFFDRVMIAVPSENLNKGKKIRVTHLCPHCFGLRDLLRL